MKKYLLLFLAFSFLFFILVSSVEAKGKHLSAGKGNVAHLYVYEQDSNRRESVEGVTWEKITYNLSGRTFNFVFNGQGFQLGWKYKLTYYPDWQRGKAVNQLEDYFANGESNVHTANLVELNTNLHTEYDKYYPDGPRVWLGLTDDVGHTNLSTRLRLLFRQAKNDVRLSIKPLKYPFEIQTLPKQDSWFLAVWQRVEIICTLCFPF